jgi:hypothetical protein
VRLPSGPRPPCCLLTRRRTGEMGYAFVTGMQSGRRRNASSTATARMAATCKHFAAYGSPQGGLNTAPVHGGERELRTMYLPPFLRACVQGGALSMMTAYSSYDGVPVIADTHLLTDIVRAGRNLDTADADARRSCAMSGTTRTGSRVMPARSTCSFPSTAPATPASARPRRRSKTIRARWAAGATRTSLSRTRSGTERSTSSTSTTR